MSDRAFAVGPRGALLYDADCGFCTRVVSLAPRLGVTAQCLPMQSMDDAATGVDPLRARREIPFVAADGTVEYGAPAIAAALASGNRLSRIVSRIVLTRALRPVADAVYGLVARNRHRLPGGTAACALRAAPGRGGRPGDGTR